MDHRDTDRRRKIGVALAGVTAVVSGVAVFVNGYGVQAWGEFTDATTYTTVKNTVAAVLIAAFAASLTRQRSSEALTRPAGWRAWAGLATVAVVGGSIPFALFFEGLARASSVQAAFIHKTLILWVAILAVGLLRERLGPLHVVAIALLTAGQVTLAGGLSGLGLGPGELMILGATLLWSVEVVLAKRLLASVSSATVATARMAGGALVLIAWVIVRGSWVDLSAMTLRHLGWVIVTGAVLALYVGSWFAALARAQAVDVTAVLVAGAVITALLRTAVQGTPLPSVPGLAVVGVGAALAGLASRRIRTSA